MGCEVDDCRRENKSSPPRWRVNRSTKLATQSWPQLRNGSLRWKYVDRFLRLTVIDIGNYGRWFFSKMAPVAKASSWWRHVLRQYANGISVNSIEFGEIRRNRLGERWRNVKIKMAVVQPNGSSHWRHFRLLVRGTCTKFGHPTACGSFLFPPTRPSRARWQLRFVER